MEFYLNFVTSGAGIKQIDEPIGFDALPFVIKQDEGRKGRDTLFAGSSEANITLTKYVDRYGFYFEQVLADWLRYGFNVQIELGINYGDDIEIIGDLTEFQYNGFDRIECVVRQRLTEAKFKLNMDTQTNLKSDVDIEGNPIEKPLPVKFLQKDKPIQQTSEWGLVPFDYSYVAGGANANEMAFNSMSIFFNPLQNQIQFEVENSLTFADNVQDSDWGHFRIIQAARRLNNVKFRFDTNILYKYRPNEFAPGLDKAGALGLFIAVGQNMETAQISQVWYNGSEFEFDLDFYLPTTLEYTIPFINQTDNVYVFFRATSKNGAVNRIQFGINDKITITASSEAINTVFYAYRLIDVYKYVIKSASGLDVVAPHYDFGGDLYDTFVVNTPLMRGLNDKPFNMSCKDILDEHVRPENNGDFEITPDGKVFLGFYRDFYNNVEIGAIDQDVQEGYSRRINERYTLKNINHGFKYYASQKERETENTYDIVHGDEQDVLPNPSVNSNREAMVGIIRDAYLLSETQRKSYDVSKTAATQDENKKFYIDAVRLFTPPSYTIKYPILHIATGIDFNLVLVTDGSFIWTVLGLGVGDSIYINGQGGLNTGTYTINDISERRLSLSTTGGFPQQYGQVNTEVTYTIASDVLWTNRTTEGFTYINNLSDGDKYSNLRFTTKRVLKNYFQEELATACLYSPNQEIRRTLYNNNPACITQYQGEIKPIVEGENFVPTGAILTPMEADFTFFLTFQEFWELQQKVRTERGFIRTWDANGMPFKGYIKGEGTWTALSRGELPSDERIGKFTCTLEEKYEPFYMTIFADGNVVVINEETQPTGFYFRIDQYGYLEVFDSLGRRLYTPVPYDRVKFNNAPAASSPEQLGQWLSLYDNV